MSTCPVLKSKNKKNVDTKLKTKSIEPSGDEVLKYRQFIDKLVRFEPPPYSLLNNIPDNNILSALIEITKAST